MSCKGMQCTRVIFNALDSLVGRDGCSLALALESNPDFCKASRASSEIVKRMICRGETPLRKSGKDPRETGVLKLLLGLGRTARASLMWLTRVAVILVVVWINPGEMLRVMSAKDCAHSLLGAAAADEGGLLA